MAKKNGRPKIEFNMEQVERLAAIQCTEEEIALALGCSIDTVRDRKRNDEDFSNALLKGRGTGKASLRRSQFALATAGNATMLIWLGKQYLGQQDKQELEHTGKDGGPIELNYAREELARRIAGIRKRQPRKEDS